ncbi:MAG: hypothetical protein ACYTHK_18015 [Planctomycetota bacterium]|jgi:hypothetical protein
MSLTRYFLHDFWTAAEFNEIEQKTNARQRVERKARRRATAERAELEEDAGFLALTLMGLIRSLVAKGVISREELLREMRALDAADGEVDGRMDPDAVRDAMGMQPPPKPEPKAPVPKRKRRN